MKLPKPLAHTASKTAFLALVAISLAPAQNSDFSPAKFDVDLDAGAQLFMRRDDPLQSKILNAKLFGMHVTENLWSHWSLEQSFSGSSLADLTLVNPVGSGFSSRVDLEQHVFKIGFNPVYHFTPNGSRVRPFVTFGLTEEIFAAASEGKTYAAALVPSAPFKSDYKAAFNYGGGVKVRFTERLGLRMDVRGYWGGEPTWGLPPVGSTPSGVLYMPAKGSLLGVDMTAGIVFSFGGGPRAPKPQPRPEPQPEPAKPVATPRTFELSAVQCNPSSGYPGDVFNCTTTLTDSANASSDKITWNVDGSDQSATGAQIQLSNLAVGAHTVKASATDTAATNETANAAPATVTVNELPPLTVTDNAANGNIKFGDTDALSAQASGPSRCDPITYTWSTNIGSIRGSGPNVTFDSSSVEFDAANVFKSETRTATITLTVSDKCGRSVTATPIQIIITKDAKAMRLDDLIYGKGSSRVNNCAKRILLDELQALMNNNPDVEVVFVGHTDENESTRGAKGRPTHLDRERVYNAAAVLTAGTGVCGKADLSRIKVSYAGTTQTSDFRSGFCGTSSRAKSDERKADEIAADDAAAKNRRVEIWIVPKGVAMPAGAPNPVDAPANIVKAKGCPH
ncbi:MAG TPA: outer membrane beta-barrel protein [Bryobacteraceae bacterium]|jgi:outer membrane protein OmpA-like peptidoglycan-associated protein